MKSGKNINLLLLKIKLFIANSIQPPILLFNRRYFAIKPKNTFNVTKSSTEHFLRNYQKQSHIFCL